MPKGILKLQLQAARGTSRRRLHAMLTEVAQDTNRAKNAMIRHWIRWKEDHPDWTPGQRRTRDGSPKVNAKGEPVLEDPVMSQDFQKQLYHCARSVAPRISSNVISGAWVEVVSDLKDRVPYNHQGTAKYVWESLVRFERSPATYRSLTFPAPNKESRLWYAGQHKPLSTGVDARIEKYAGNSAVVRFPLWSREAGYHHNDVVARVSIGKLSVGNRKLLMRIASDQLKMADSRITERRGKWYFDLVYEVPIKNHELDPERRVVLRMGRDNSFDLALPDGRVWQLGDDQILLKEYERLVQRRKVMRFRSRHQHGKGHGKNRFYQRLRPHSRRYLDMQDEYRRHLMADLIRACIKLDCGTVEYREPTMPLREKSWFAHHGIPFNWSEFLPLLKFKLECNTIEIPKIQRMGMQEWREMNATAHCAAK